jgi:hypothetical protein
MYANLHRSRPNFGETSFGEKLFGETSFGEKTLNQICIAEMLSLA